MLSNISVRSKLILGFVLVIILTVLIAFTGWSGIKILTERSERVADIGKLGALTRDMLIGRLSYTISYDAERAATWLSAIENLENYLVYVRSVLRSDSDTLRLETAALALNQSRSYYNDIISATGTMVDNRTAAGQQADAAADELSELFDF
ncbi:methyl-accepting chemotaxis protein, partial [Pseudomonas sp. GV047]|uniref:methyl-accepting chemotaxis protein n=1 Tax=Pseudomonas sp. GV047 TaxID=2135751 RepID=UPI00211552D3